SGGDQKALVKTICSTAYGAVLAWIALLIIFRGGVGGMGTAAIAIVVGVTVFFLVIVAKVDALSVVPANVYGYAATVAYALHQAGALDNLTSPCFANPLILLIASFIRGATGGYLSGQLAGLLTKKAIA